MAGRFSVEAVFKAVDRVTAPVTRMQNRVGKFTRGMNRGFRNLNRNVSKFTGGIKKAGIAIVAALAISGAAMANVISTGASFEQAITDVGAVSLQTRKEIKPLEDLALSLGRSTKFTSTQAANAMEVMARAGFKANDILRATPAVLSAAAASGLEIAEVANHVSNVLKGMGLETSEAARVSDVLALASARTNSSIGSLGESMKNVASTARMLNIPLEDAVASVALLQDVGLDASVAGSAFNVMLTKMAAPSKTITKIMKRLRISFKNAKGDMKALPEVLSDISKASKKMGGNFDQVAFLAELVGLRGQKAAGNLSKLFETGKLKELTKELQNAKGSADKMAAIRMDTFEGSLLLLGSAVDAVKVKIFDLQDGALKDLVDQMTKWVGINEDVIASGIGGLITMLIENLPAIATAILDIGAGVVGIIALSIALKAIVVILTIINLLVAANPITLGIMAAVVAVGLLIAAFTDVGTWIRSISSNIGGLFSGISKLSSLFGGTFGFGGDESEARTGATGPQMISPQERVARSIEEQRTTNTTELTVRAGEGATVEVTGGKLGSGLSLMPSGAF